ncbi:alkaline phosphatase family protein [Haloterrigena salifodinae]|uniref:alkaline phosphatase family protein n=1 Tax=Haloterrigena salifodinae TaxID=2675099 RepID=UPI0013DEB72C|nr:alkaline phosphatase family protein [Haloterrigena salifodinae]
MTIVVLAIDAIDHALVDHFGLDALCLETDREIKTFNYSLEVPYTPEVWTTVATGLPIEEHDVKNAGTSEWSNPVLEFASKFTGHLSEHTRYRLGQLVTTHTGEDWGFGATDMETMFSEEGRYLHNWPGIDNSDVDEVHGLYNKAIDGELVTTEFDAAVYSIAAQEFEWVEERLRCRDRVGFDPSLLGVHTHILDAAGHIYAEDEDKLREFYQWVADRVRSIRTQLDTDDELLLLGDHGMEAEFLGDDTAGQHSWRPHVASTADSVPMDVVDVREWVESRLDDIGRRGEEMEVPEEQLRDLGYIS